MQPSITTDPAGSHSFEIGLLVCDHLDPDVADAVGGDYETKLFPEVFAPHGVRFRAFDLTAGEFPVSVDECDGWMTTGSRFSAYDDIAWIHQLSALLADIVDARRPLVAVCFGHQLLAMALGGRVGLAEVGWGVGVKEFEVVAPQAWMQPGKASIRMLMSHRDQVLDLPDAAHVFARSDYCPVAGYTVGDRVLSMQGHPEFVPELSRILLGRRREMIGADVADAALASLDGPYDRELVASWIADFYRGALA